MEDVYLLSPQIKDNCRLALPEGLQELMNDISREVLRYQPRDLYKFIADYLAALLITRDNLSIAGQLCNDISQFNCQPELQVDLRDIGLSSEDMETAKEIIVNYLEKGSGKESNLLMKLVKETNITEEQLPAVRDAIRNAFLRHQAYHTTIYQSSSDSEQDEMMCAAKHTLKLYRKLAHNERTYDVMADKIHTSYRAYGVKRDRESKSSILKTKDKEEKKLVPMVDPKVIPPMPNAYDSTFPNQIFHEDTASIGSGSEDPDIKLSFSMSQKRINTVSSTSLAGSYLSLPHRKPYSAHVCDVLSDLEEYPEKEKGYIDYTDEDTPFNMAGKVKKFFIRKDGGKKISFNDDVKKEKMDDGQTKDMSRKTKIILSKVVTDMKT